MGKRDRISGFIWLILGTFFSIGSSQLNIGDLQNPGPGFLPLLTGVLLGILGLTLIFSTFKKKWKEKENKEDVREEILEKWNWKNYLVPLLAVLILLVYSFLMEPLGFLLSTFLFLFFLFKLCTPKKWGMPFIYSIISVTFSYLVFSIWLNCQLPRGVIEILLKR